MPGPSYVDESVRSVDDLDHQLFHLLIVKPRHTRPGNHAERTGDGNIGIIASRRRGGDPAWRSSSREFRMHCRTRYLARRCWRTALVRMASRCVERSILSSPTDRNDFHTMG